MRPPLKMNKKTHPQGLHIHKTQLLKQTSPRRHPMTKRALGRARVLIPTAETEVV